MNKRYEERKNRLLPGGEPRYVHCYDNGDETADRYTAVYTGNYTSRTGGYHWYVGMSGKPFHPQGYGMHGESDTQIDYPSYKHLGKKIKYEQLPEDCRQLVLQDYVYLWGITDHPLYKE